ncbi:MAG: hypothetical protein ACOZNI_11760 [Myxococcota bacterium]
MDPTQVGSGVITGGSEYVWAVYVVTWLVIGLYAARVFATAEGGAR